MTPSWIEPPPPPRQTGSGCFAKGCGIVSVFCLVLAAAFVVGSLYAVKHLRANFFATDSVEMPATTSTEEEQQLALAKWKIFERSARAHAPARVEMTADEINALIAAEPRLRGKIYVAIDGNTGRLKVSIPLESRWFRGRYVNGDCVVRAATDGDATNIQITDVVINGHAIPDDVLTFHGPYTLHRYIEEWDQEDDIKTLDIRDGKLILETKGSGGG